MSTHKLHRCVPFNPVPRCNSSSWAQRTTTGSIAPRTGHQFSNPVPCSNSPPPVGELSLTSPIHVDECPFTDPVRAEHNGLYELPQVLFLYPIEILSSCQSFFYMYPHTCSELGPYPAFFVFPPPDFIHQGHSKGKDCF